MKTLRAHNLKQTWLALMLIALAAPAAQAQQNNEYLGVHLLFLGNYNDPSMTNVKTVVTEKDAPSKIQIISVLAFHGNGASDAAAWSNLDTVVRAVNDSGRTIVVGIALSFHANSTSLSSKSDTDYRVVYKKAVGQLADFYQRHITAITSGKLRVVILPSLEDSLSNTSKFISLAKATVTQLNSALKARRVSGIDSVIVRRSVVSVDKRGTADELNKDCQKIAGTTGLGVNCQYQVHGPSRRGNVWSNDGIFVYADIQNLTWTEDKDSADNSETFKDEPKKPLTAFTTSASPSSPVAMLWRPAFNLWTREVKNGRVRYNKPSAIRGRGDYVDGNQPAFSVQEMTVVRYFLSNAPRRR